MFVQEVGAVIREVAMVEVVPRFRALAAGDIMEKSPGDLVTIADRECERVLARRLQQIRPVPVIGEEATSADPQLLDVVGSAPACWIVDPIDGTSNFVNGNPNFVVMVAYADAGVTTAAWIWHPETDSMLTAQRGHGVHRNGVPVPIPERASIPTGILKRFYLPEPARTLLAEIPKTAGQLVPAIKSAGVEYTALVHGDVDFLFYWRTLPWDHAPGGLIAEEAGLRVARLDGSPYRPGDGQAGVLAATPAAWDIIADTINEALDTSI